MRQWIKIILVFIGAIALLVVILFGDFFTAFSGKAKRVDFISADKASRLYIKIFNWGVTGDRQLTAITIDDDIYTEADSTTDIIFHGLDPFLFQQKHDTLLIYVEESARVPAGFKSCLIVKQIIVSEKTRQGLRHNPEYGKI